MRALLLPSLLFVFILAASCASGSGDTPVDTYAQRMDACLARLEGENAGLSPSVKRKECRAEVGPSPIAVPAKAPAIF